MQLNLRKKIILHFLIFILVNGGIWVFSYYSNSTIIQKLIILEKKKVLLDTILEARRYEKNFFLEKNPESLKKALSYIRDMAEKQEEIVREFSTVLEDPEGFRRRAEPINAYRQNMEALYEIFQASNGLSPRIPEIQKQVTELGRTLTRDIERFEEREQNRVFSLLKQSKNYLMASMVFLFLLSIVTTFFLVLNVNRPLKAIEQGIRRIVRGEFNKIPGISTGDEFESLVDSLNTMIHELDKKRSQLAQADKMSSLGTLTSGVAHELNNPLNNISTSIQILREEIQEGDVDHKKKMLILAEQEVDRARDIIRALLEFSRQTQFSIHWVDFKDLVQDTMRLIAGEIPANVETKIQVPDRLEGEMDPRRIQQVLMNLIINGIHAMPQGGRLTLSAFLDDINGNFVFRISDTGEGIAEDMLAKIFDPFFTTKEVGKGTGLGLSITHGIIEQHKGQIQVKSRPGKGTAVTVRLPRGYKK